MSNQQNDVNHFKVLKPFSRFPKSKQNQFSIISWNTLIKTDDGNNGSSEHSKWEHRLSNIQKTILSFECDIVCLQECHTSSFNTDFADFCAKHGYDFKLNDEIYDKLKRQNKMETADIKALQCADMTTAILWKKHKFKCKYHDFRSKATIVLLEMINDENEEKKTEEKKKRKKPMNAYQLYLTENNISKSDASQKWNGLTLKEKEIYIEKARNLKNEWKANKRMDAELKEKNSLKLMKECIFLTNVHLEAHGNDKDKKISKAEQRFNQIKHSIERIINYTKQQLRVNKMEYIQCIFCGDFNDNSQSEIHKMLTNTSNKSDFVHGMQLKNAYIDNIIDIDKQNDIISHWCSQRLIDHFYYTHNNLKCMLCMETMPDFMKMNNNLINMKYPNKDIVSDHLPIATMFEITNNDNNTNKRKRQRDDDGNIDKSIDEENEINQPEKKKRKLNC